MQTSSIQRIIFCFFIFLLQTMPSVSQSQILDAINKKRAEPEAATGTEKKKIIKANKFLIVTANPHATKAGYEMLSKGGTAVDAMIAAQLVLNLTEPQSSGIGGGAFLLHWDQKNKELLTYDGRETAPSSVKPNHFIDDQGNPLKFHDAIKQGLAIGIPGLVKLLEDTHKAHGKLPWQDLFKPAIQLSKAGFQVSTRLNMLLEKVGAEKFSGEAKTFFFDADNKPHPVGHILKNPAFSETLEQIAVQGSKGFYQGKISNDIIQLAAKLSNNKHTIKQSDFDNYKVKKRPAVCTIYRSHKICGMGLPSSGGLTVAQVLKLIETYNLKAGAKDHQTLHYIAEAQKLAYADRARYMADPDFVSAPKGLLNEKYIAKRRKLIQKSKAVKKAKPGIPELKKQGLFGIDASKESSGTSHISIIDQYGNAVSLTTTIETGFGSKVMVGGFLLNNQLTDFSFKPIDKNGMPIANRIQAGKRPRSSMAPTIVFDKDGDIELVLGSPGGSRIILYVLKTLIAMIDWNMDQQAAVELANFGSRNGPFELEAPGDNMTQLFLKTFGHKVRITPMTSGLHVILKTKEGLYSGVDPRREGSSLGR